MTFLRVKRIRHRPYAYLVENAWVAARGQSRQRTVGYLGRLERVRAGQIPPAYRTPEILRRLATEQEALRQRRRPATGRFRDRFLAALLDGDAERTRRVARAAVGELGREEFLTQVVVGALHEIGERWAAGTTTVSQEHLASSTLESYLARFRAPTGSNRASGPEVVVCVPDGEQHTHSLLLAEIALREKGYRPINLGPSAPNPDTVSFVRLRRPSAVWISVTQPATMEAALRLARELRRAVPTVRVAIGGQAVASLAPSARPSGVDLYRGSFAEFIRGGSGERGGRDRSSRGMPPADCQSPGGRRNVRRTVASPARP